MCSILWQGPAQRLEELVQFVPILPVFSWVHILSLFIDLFLAFPLHDASVTEAMFWSIHESLSTHNKTKQETLHFLG